MQKLLLRSLLCTLTLFTINSNAQFKHFKLTKKGQPGVMVQQPDFEEGVRDEVSSVYKKVSAEKALAILAYNKLFVLGDYNKVGFEWSKIAGGFAILVNREILPDLSTGKWRVVDTMDIILDAEKTMSGMRSQGILSISDEELQNFAQIHFKRRYTSIQNANSYEEGLNSSFDYLFLSFTKFKNGKYLNLEKNEELLREDSLAISTGYGFSAPVFQNVVVRGDFLARFTKLASLKIHSAENENSQEELKITKTKESLQDTEFKLSLMLDFYNLMRISLFSMSYEESLAHGESFELSFDQSERELLKTDLALQQQVERTFKDHKIGPELDRYLNRQIDIESNHKRVKRQIVLNNFELLDQEEYAFERFNSSYSSEYLAFFEALSYVKSPLQFLKDSLMTPIPLNTLKESPMKSHRARIWLMHDIQGDTIEEQGLMLSNIEDFGLSISERYFVNSASKRKNVKLKEETIDYLYSHAPLERPIIEATENDILLAPLNISTNYDLNWQALDYFESLGEKGVLATMKRHCNSALSGRTKQYERRSCKKNSKKIVREYFDVNRGRVARDLRPFYDLLKLIVKVELNKDIIAKLFGDLNLRNSGYMQSQTNDEQEFRAYF